MSAGGLFLDRQITKKEKTISRNENLQYLPNLLLQAQSCQKILIFFGNKCTKHTVQNKIFYLFQIWLVFNNTSIMLWTDDVNVLTEVLHLGRPQARGLYQSSETPEGFRYSVLRYADIVVIDIYQRF